MPRTSICRARIAALRIVQKGSGVNDFQIGPFSFGDALGHAIHAQDVVKVVDSIGILIPVAGFIQTE